MASPTKAAKLSQPLLSGQTQNYGSTSAPSSDKESITTKLAQSIISDQRLETQTAPPIKATIQGTLSKDGWTYVGEIQNNQPNGRGIKKLANGDVYESDWVNDKMDGKAILNFADGRVYEGDVRNHTSHGKGTLKYPDGTVNEGDWVDGKLNGKVTIKYANGDVYEGEYINNHYHGNGTLFRVNARQTGTWNEGRFWEGTWSGPSGQWKVVNGVRQEGICENCVCTLS